MLSNAYFLAKFRFDTAENEPAKNLQNFRKMHFRKMHFLTKDLIRKDELARLRAEREARDGRRKIAARWRPAKGSGGEGDIFEHVPNTYRPCQKQDVRNFVCKPQRRCAHMLRLERFRGVRILEVD